MILVNPEACELKRGSAAAERRARRSEEVSAGLLPRRPRAEPFSALGGRVALAGVSANTPRRGSARLSSSERKYVTAVKCFHLQVTQIDGQRLGGTRSLKALLRRR